MITNRNRRLISRGSVIAGGAAAMAATQWTQALAQNTTFQIRAACSLPNDHPTTIRAVQMWAAVEKDSGGRLQVQFFPNSALGGDAAMLGQIRVGATQMMFVSPSNLAPVVPAADIANLGYTFKDADEALAVMDGSLGDYIRGEIAAKGLHGLHTFYDGGMYHIEGAGRPINSPDDFHGFKIRVPAGRIMTDLYKEFGASPVSISASEMYTAQQTKIVDGCTLPLISFTAFRMYEVSKYLSLTNNMWSGIIPIANGDFWNGLPPELQQVLERNNTKYGRLERSDAKQVQVALMNRLVKAGIIVNKTDQVPFRKKLGTYFEYWADAFGPASWKALEAGLHRTV